MTYTEHTIVKPKDLSATALGLVSREMVIPQLFAKTGIDQYRGKLDDSINVRVPGLLVAHDYNWRNDRSQPIQTDTYTERSITMRFGGHAYSALHLTDEQMDMDLQSWGPLLEPQCRAVARHIEHKAYKTLADANYAISLKASEDNIANDIVEARRCLNRMTVPSNGRYLLVGSDFETVLQTDPTFNQANVVGDVNANSALKDATIGRWKGFTIVTSEVIGADEAYAFVPEAFTFLSVAPWLPDSAGLAASTSYDGIAMRWIRDYDSQYLMDRSVVDTYYGFQDIKDPIAYWDETAGREVVSEGEYLIRAVKLSLSAKKDSYFDAAAGTGAAKVGKALGLAGRAKATTAKATPAA